MIVMVVDGQGGGIGATLIKGLRNSTDREMEILALGTNSIATSRMMKAGANKGATGERAIVRTSAKVDVIVGPLAIVVPDSMMGELTPNMASAVSASEAKKILIPLTQENIEIVGVSGEPLPHLVDQVVEIIKEMESHV
jgi:hypothetical protein